MTKAESDFEAADNPYETPINAEAPPAEEPSVGAWVGVCGITGATLCGIGEWLGRIPALTHWPSGFGGIITGGLVGGIIGRVIGRLLVARFRFRQLSERSEARRAEFEESQQTNRGQNQ